MIKTAIITTTVASFLLASGMSNAENEKLATQNKEPEASTPIKTESLERLVKELKRRNIKTIDPTALSKTSGSKYCYCEGSHVACDPSGPLQLCKCLCVNF